MNPETLVLILLAYVLGTLTGRLSMSSWQGTGGGRIKIHGAWKPFLRHELPEIIALMQPDEQAAVQRVVQKNASAEALKRQGQPRDMVAAARPTEAEQAAGEAAWESAALRWLRLHPDRARELGIALD